MAKKKVVNAANSMSVSQTFTNLASDDSSGGGEVVNNPQEKPEKPAVKSSGDQWKDFLTYAQEYKEAKRDSIQVWLDADVNYTLDAIRQSGVKIPVKHLLSAAVKVFLESNADEVRALMEKKPKMII